MATTTIDHWTTPTLSSSCTNVVNNYSWTSTVDDRDTITDQSVNQNIWADGDVTQYFDNHSVIASGDRAVAAGDDVDMEDSNNVKDSYNTDNSNDSSTDNSVNAGRDASVGNTDTDIDDSFNTDLDLDVATRTTTTPITLITRTTRTTPTTASTTRTTPTTRITPLMFRTSATRRTTWTTSATPPPTIRWPSTDSFQDNSDNSLAVTDSFQDNSDNSLAVTIRSRTTRTTRSRSRIRSRTTPRSKTRWHWPGTTQLQSPSQVRGIQAVPGRRPQSPAGLFPAYPNGQFST